MEQPTASCLRAAAQQAAQWQEIRLCDTTDSLRFKYDPQTIRIHIIRGRSEAIIDLDDYRPAPAAERGSSGRGVGDKGGGRKPATWELVDPGRMLWVAGGGTRQRAVEGILARLFWFGKGGGVRIFRQCARAPRPSRAPTSNATGRVILVLFVVTADSDWNDKEILLDGMHSQETRAAINECLTFTKRPCGTLHH
ncbi:MAG: hypothetical protein H8E35_04135 [Ardenticatenia bacterium]|nr:hypothetical protein [Ardenticatenia bacterium]